MDWQESMSTFPSSVTTLSPALRWDSSEVQSPPEVHSGVSPGCPWRLLARLHSALATLLPHAPTSPPVFPGVTSQINYLPSMYSLGDLLLGEPNPRHLEIKDI